MNCPNCMAKMDRDDTWEMEHNSFGTLVDLTPSAIYSCPECGSEYKWVRSKKLQVVYDSSKDEYQEIK